MASNYPPGVTGQEREIVGPAPGEVCTCGVPFEEHDDDNMCPDGNGQYEVGHHERDEDSYPERDL
jgi:hypothetical protein